MISKSCAILLNILKTYLHFSPDLIQPEFTLGRAVNCTFVIRKDMVKENIIKNVSKQHFVIRRDMS